MSDPKWAAYEHVGAIRRYAARRVEPDAVDDIVSETFAIAWRRLPGEIDPLPWLYTVAGRVVHRHRRSQARRARILRRATHHETAAHAVEPADMIVQDPVLAHAFEQLTAREREAICLVAWEGLSNADAARAAGCSAATVAVRYSRARSRLAGALERAGRGVTRAPSPPDPAVDPELEAAS
jgi:RNA polymerase sigma-70 factor (ECF subfamily)